ncbi:MAG: hypothetical protein H8E35_07190, partial [Ardenticatenia bacterium]|nr:hypothetical protein [Ardenticatenia bacterium]
MYDLPALSAHPDLPGRHPRGDGPGRAVGLAVGGAAVCGCPEGQSAGPGTAGGHRITGHAPAIPYHGGAVCANGQRAARHSHPGHRRAEFAKRTRGQQFFFVNQRFIKSHFLHHAILAAFEGLIPKGVHPGYFIYLQLDPKTIDINIHPTKTEVKFEDEQSLYAILRSAIKHSLGLFQVSPTLDFNRDATLDVPYHLKNKSPV